MHDAARTNRVAHRAEVTWEATMPETDALAAVLTALRDVLSESSDTHPGVLRRRLDRAVPPGVDTTRPLVHQVVAAAEEGVPDRLRRMPVVTSSAVVLVGEELARARGWSSPTALRVTRLWVAALGREEVVGPTPMGTASEPAATALPPVPSSEQPAAPVTVARTSWPPVPRGVLRTHTTTSTGQPVLGVAQGYAGMPLLVAWGLLAVLLVLAPLPVLVPAPGLVTPLCFLAAVGLATALRRGALVAGEDVVELVPYNRSMTRPRDEGRVSVPWSEVSLEPGTFSTVRLGSTRVQLGPGSRRFVDALGARVTGEG